MRLTFLTILIPFLLMAAEDGSFQAEIIDSGVWMLFPFLSIPLTLTIIIVAVVFIIKFLFNIATHETPVTTPKTRRDYR